MKHVIIGTAGHVDHGKTSLIRAMTGVDTDRLKEEQERGMTIDLGFASLLLADGTPAGIIDVPGHERFLKNMLSGAAGIDVVLLVIAADESVMPQTVEHLNILKLLNVKSGVVALTKIDMVDRHWLDLVREDVKSFLKGSFLESAQIMGVDSIKGKGIPDLKRALLSAVSKTDERDSNLPFRMSVDRVFVRPGFGPVVTGTIVAGSVRVGDSLQLLPQGQSARVRGLQSHNKKQTILGSGIRAAINVTGVDAAEIHRGNVLAAPGSMKPTSIFDCTVDLIDAESKIKHRERVRLYSGASEVIGRLHLIQNDYQQFTKNGFAQFRAEEPVVVHRGERFVLRRFSPLETIGGGVVLDTSPPKHKRIDPSAVVELERRQKGTPEDLIETMLLSAEFGLERSQLGSALGLTDVDVNNGVEKLRAADSLEPLTSGRVIHRAKLAAVQQKVLAIIEQYHEQFPLRGGMPKEELRSALGRAVDSKALNSLLGYWVSQSLVATEGAFVSRLDFEVTLNSKQQALLDRIMAYLISAAYEGPTLLEVANEVRIPIEAMTAMIRVARDRGDIVLVGDNFHYHREVITRVKSVVTELASSVTGVTVASFREKTSVSRKYILPLLEHMDSIGFTVRKGDTRVLL
ncbi:MAG: selenocysteine-specific translation elongation factor [Chthonomonadales bacterium]